MADLTNESNDLEELAKQISKETAGVAKRKISQKGKEALADVIKAASGKATAGAAAATGGVATGIAPVLLVIVVVLLILIIILFIATAENEESEFSSQLGAISEAFGIDPEAAELLYGVSWEEFSQHLGYTTEDMYWLYERGLLDFGDGMFGILTDHELKLIIDECYDNLPPVTTAYTRHRHDVYTVDDDGNIVPADELPAYLEGIEECFDDNVWNVSSESDEEEEGDTEDSDGDDTDDDIDNDSTPWARTIFLNCDFENSGTTVKHKVYYGQTECSVSYNNIRDEYSTEWQVAAVLCIMRGMTENSQWGSELTEQPSFFKKWLTPILGGAVSDNRLQNYFLTTSDIGEICDILSYDFEYYYDAVENGRSLFSDGSVSSNAPDSQDYSWLYYDIDSDCEESFIGNAYPGYSTDDGLNIDSIIADNGTNSYFRTCRLPISSPKSITNSYETIVYIVEDISGDTSKAAKYAPYTYEYEASRMGGVIVARMIHLTPHNFYNECMSVTNNNFDWDLFLMMLSQMPQSEGLYEKYAHLYELYQATESDNEMSLTTYQREGEFDAYGVVIGSENPNYTPMDMLSFFSVGEMYVSSYLKSDGTTVDANVGFKFLPSSFMDLSENNGTDNLTESQLETLADNLGLSEVWKNSLRGAKWYYDAGYTGDLAAFLAIIQTEGMDGSGSVGSWDWQAQYTYNFINWSGGSFTKKPYCVHLNDGTVEVVHYSDLFDYIHNKMPSLESAILTSYSETYGVSCSDIYDLVENEGAFAIIQHYLNGDGNKTWCRTNGEGFFSVNRFEDYYEVVTSNSSYMEDLRAKCGYFTSAQITDEDISCYCLYLQMKDIYNNYLNSEQNSFFLMCWNGIPVDSEGFPLYKTQEEVEAYEAETGAFISNSISHSYCPWFGNAIPSEGTEHWAYSCASKRDNIARAMNQIYGDSIVYIPRSSPFGYGVGGPEELLAAIRACEDIPYGHRNHHSQWLSCPADHTYIFNGGGVLDCHAYVWYILNQMLGYTQVPRNGYDQASPDFCLYILTDYTLASPGDIIVWINPNGSLAHTAILVDPATGAYADSCPWQKYANDGRGCTHADDLNILTSVYSNWWGTTSQTPYSQSNPSSRGWMYICHYGLM